MSLYLFNAFSADYQDMFVQQQQKTMDKIVNFFQIYHTMDQPLCKQYQHEATARKECKEANQERDATNKEHAAAQKDNSLSTNNDHSNKCGRTENLCCHCNSKGQFCCMEFLLLSQLQTSKLCQPMGLSTNSSQDKSSKDWDGYCNTRDCCCSHFHSCSLD